MAWIGKQREMAQRVVTCYESGAFGFVLHRQLEEMGVENYVIVPQNWDDRRKRVKTDKIDATKMLYRLSDYVDGDKKALGVVKVPSLEEELKRARGRLRGQMRDERKRLEAQGRSLLLNYGLQFKGRWWTKTHWPEVKKLICKELAEILEEIRGLVLAVHEKLEKLTKELEEKAQKGRPKGYGKLTSELLDREIIDWNRFKNRRQVASYAGLCPGVSQSEDTVQMKSITKTGNARVRAMLVEIVWLLIRYQPEYYAVKKWRAVLEGTGRASKRKAVIAIARHLIVDLWRLKTNRANHAELGLVMSS